MTSTIMSLDAVRTDIAEVLEHSNPNRPDYSTDVELEQLERWQVAIVAAGHQRDKLLAAAEKLRAWLDDDPSAYDGDDDGSFGRVIGGISDAIAVARGGS